MNDTKKKAAHDKDERQAAEMAIMTRPAPA
jgi:hypothetical protein